MPRPKRRPRYCAGCQKRTERASGMCQSCDPPTGVIALVGGRWVPVRGVLRWVPDDTTTAA